MDSDARAYYSVIVGGFEPSSPTLSSSLGSNHVPVNDVAKYYQCIDSEDVALLGCQDCGSFFESSTYCPLLLEL